MIIPGDKMQAAIDGGFARIFGNRREPKPGERIVYDDGFTRFFVTDPPELLHNIGRTKARYLADPKVWADVLSDFATEQACRALDGKFTHACFDTIAAGDPAQFGALLAKTLRPKIEQKADDDTRDAWGDEQDEREGRGERRAEEAERRARAQSEDDCDPMIRSHDPRRSQRVCQGRAGICGW